MQPVGKWRCENVYGLKKIYGSHFALFPINPVCCSAGCNDHRLAEQAGNQNISFCLDLQIVVLLLVKAKVISKSIFHSTLRFWTCLTWNLSAASIRVCVNKNDCVLTIYNNTPVQIWVSEKDVEGRAELQFIVYIQVPGCQSESHQNQSCIIQNLSGSLIHQHLLQ